MMKREWSLLGYNCVSLAIGSAEGIPWLGTFDLSNRIQTFEDCALLPFEPLYATTSQDRHANREMRYAKATTAKVNLYSWSRVRCVSSPTGDIHIGGQLISDIELSSNHCHYMYQTTQHQRRSISVKSPKMSNRVLIHKLRPFDKLWSILKVRPSC